MKRFIVVTCVVVLFLSSCNHSQQNIKDIEKPKNIVLLIGDGMGVAQIYAAMSVATETLNIEKFKIVGFHKTYSLDNYITDSGAGGTALATGNKTKNKHIATDSLGNSLKSILEYAEENNLATGLVVTSAITHATPASFIAHDTSRYNYENIAKDFLDVDIDLFIGGGKKHFNEREDGLNLIDSLKEDNYNIIDGFHSFDPKQNGKFAVFTADGHNPEVNKGRGDMLPISTQKALTFLDKSEKGFFLMVEGSQIDWGGHDNDIEYVTSEVIDFDKAVGEALKFAEIDGETLVIITADHETGGLSLPEGNDIKKGYTAHFSSDHHTGVMVPVFAYGSGAESFGGIYQNTDVFEKMMSAFGFKK
jgi:alkaline phosphatase